MIFFQTLIWTRISGQNRQDIFLGQTEIWKMCGQNWIFLSRFVQTLFQLLNFSNNTFPNHIREGNCFICFFVCIARDQKFFLWFRIAFLSGLYPISFWETVTLSYFFTLIWKDHWPQLKGSFETSADSAQ